MADSINATLVAQDVLNCVRKGKKINLQTIQRNRGYSKHSAHAMRATRTQTYQKIMQGFVQSMTRERTRILRAMKKVDLVDVKYKDMIDGVDKLTKNIQLVQGEPTGIVDTMTKDDVQARIINLQQINVRIENPS